MVKKLVLQIQTVWKTKCEINPNVLPPIGGAGTTYNLVNSLGTLKYINLKWKNYLIKT